MRITVQARFFILVATLALFGVSGGCGSGKPERVPVSGQVLIDGKPLPCGEIMFVPASGRSSSGEIDSDGRFQLSSYGDKDGAAIGTHRIAVTAIEKLPSGKYKLHAPKKYGDYATSGLEKEITGPTNELVIELTWAGGSPFVIGEGNANTGKRESGQE